MKRPLIAATLLAALFTQMPTDASADGVHNGYGQAHGHGHVHQSGHAHQNANTVSAVVTISCFRGPWQEVIWDRPEPIFVDSLVGAGYTFPEAHAIAERVCRDASGVGNSANIRSTMLRIIEDTPPHFD